MKLLNIKYNEKILDYENLFERNCQAHTCSYIAKIFDNEKLDTKFH